MRRIPEIRSAIGIVPRQRQSQRALHTRVSRPVCRAIGRPGVGNGLILPGNMRPALDILFENEHYLLINKPAGLSTQAPAGIVSLETHVRNYLEHERRADSVAVGTQYLEVQVYLGLPHRLDRPVSGVIVLAKTKKAARKISSQFERRRVRKLYWAAVSGTVESAEGTWTDTLRKVPDVAHVEIVADDHPEGQRAVLHYRLLGTIPGGSWLEIELETGRMHQIRVQAAARGHSILGDMQYGSSVTFGPLHDDARLRAIALHARMLEFNDPENQERRTFTAPLTEAWREIGIEEPSI